MHHYVPISIFDVATVLCADIAAHLCLQYDQMCAAFWNSSLHGSSRGWLKRLTLARICSQGRRRTGSWQGSLPFRKGVTGVEVEVPFS